ncbi:MAG: DedA family protein [Wenzhouxiangellaceae bacterium]|nr:DedA family protein [Wenzhouxiangellaceae bacterium]
MPDFQQLLQWSADHPGWVVAGGFVLAFVEALAVVGIVVPGIFLLFVLGALVGLDPGLLTTAIVAVMAGAVAGDGASFWLGRRYRERLRSTWPFVGRENWLDAGEQFFFRYGGKSIFIARFVGPLRPIVPLVAGSMGMPPPAFVPRMLFACLLWAPLMLVPGALFGESLELAAEFGGRLTMLLVLLVLGGWFVLWLTRYVYERGARRAPWWLKNLALWLRRHPLLGRWFGPLVEPGGREVLSVVILGLLLVVSLAALSGALLLAPLSRDAWETGFELTGLAASLRSHFADPLFFVVALAVSRPVLAALIVMTAIVLVLGQRWNALAHWLLATVGGWMLALLLNALTGLLLGRPEAGGSIAQIPHLDSVLAVAVFGFAALMAARNLRPRQRKWLYLATVALLALAMFAQFYLARATLDGLIAAVALGGGWLAAAGIGYRLNAGAPQSSGLAVLLFSAAWLSLAAIAVGARYPEFAGEHELVQPRRALMADHWFDGGWRQLPQERSRIGNPERRRFDAQIAAARGELAQTLRAQGWAEPPALSPAAFRAMFSSRPNPARLPHMPRDFAGQPEDLAMQLMLPDRRVALLRAWDSGARLEPQGEPVWLVQARVLAPETRLGLVNAWVDAGEDARAVELLRAAAPDWHWRRIESARLWLANSDNSAGQSGES